MSKKISPLTCAIIIPVHDEAECLPLILHELYTEIARIPAQLKQPVDFIVCAGLNATTDTSDTIVKKSGTLYGETQKKGYGYGCMTAITKLEKIEKKPAVYLFYAADGANNPKEIPRLLNAYLQGSSMVLGMRTLRWKYWKSAGLSRALPNLILGLYASILGRKLYLDLGPFRLIDRQLFQDMKMRELEWGWTIEPQILAPRLGAVVKSLSVEERPRIAGEQKISGVSWKGSLRIGLKILQAGIRTARRPLPQKNH